MGGGAVQRESTPGAVMGKEVLTTKQEIMDALDCSSWSRVENLRQEGLVVKKIGGRWQTTRTEIRRFYSDHGLAIGC